jgi:hypothetical protein
MTDHDKTERVWDIIDTGAKPSLGENRKVTVKM